MSTISTKTDYGLLLLTSIAERHTQEPISLTDVAREKHLPMRYLAQIAVQLKKAGLLVSKEGVGGGYMLARDPADIKVSDVFDAIEGGIFPVQCMQPDRTVQCASSAKCTNYFFWSELRQRMNDLLEKTTVASLVHEHATAKAV